MAGSGGWERSTSGTFRGGGGSASRLATGLSSALRRPALGASADAPGRPTLIKATATGIDYAHLALPVAKIGPGQVDHWLWCADAVLWAEERWGPARLRPSASCAGSSTPKASRSAAASLASSQRPADPSQAGSPRFSRRPAILDRGRADNESAAAPRAPGALMATGPTRGPRHLPGSHRPPLSRR